MSLAEPMDTVTDASAGTVDRHATTDTFESTDPASGAVVGVFPVHETGAVQEAVHRARSAARQWAELGWDGRRQRLTAFRGYVARRLHELADLVHHENGKPHADAILEISLAIDHLAWAGAHARKTLGARKVSAGMLAANHADYLEYQKQAEIDPDVDAFTAAVVLVHVHSQGSVRLRSADPAWSPAIDAGYLTDERDLDALVCGIEKAREIASVGPLASVLADEWSPGGTVHGRNALRASVRNTLESLYHPVSSCRMGTDERAVLDPQLRVRGIEGPRVADASAMPTLVRGNTNAPTMLIGERAADLILGRTAAPQAAATA